MEKQDERGGGREESTWPERRVDICRGGYLSVRGSSNPGDARLPTGLSSFQKTATVNNPFARRDVNGKRLVRAAAE